MKQKLKTNKGITLIALIITIIVLLILAVVAITAIKGDGIIAHAKNAKTQYTEAQTNETSIISGYEAYIEDSLPGAVKKVEKNLDKVLSTTDNTPLVDEFGNKITVPAGFKIITKTNTENTDLNYTADDIDVTKGIVVEDGEGNQFVWIPVGKIYTDTEKTEANAKTITLGRYSNFTKTNNAYTVAQNVSAYATPTPITIGSYSYTEYNTTQSNAIIKNIEEFCTKALASGGYYIGRYEARVENYDASNISTSNRNKTEDWTGYIAANEKKLKLVSKANSQVWNCVTQKKASSLCQSMYTNKPFESDLVNSYAWDTAIIFFQEFGENTTYSRKRSVNSSLANTGTSGTSYTGKKDIICNVYDMAGNCYEWSTETFSDAYFHCTVRGGFYYNSDFYASYRSYGSSTDANVYGSFRPLLYM